jgi:hypothetical protein
MAAITCVLCLLGLEVVSRTWMVGRVSSATAGEVAALDTALDLLPAPPTVIFLGASHTLSGVASRRIEELLGWPRGSVLNAGIPNGRPRDFLGIYRRHRAVLGKARAAFIAVDVTYFNRNGINLAGKPTPAWRRRATLADRLDFPASPETRVDLVAGWVSNVWDQRTTWREELIDLALRLRGTPRGARGRHLFDELGRPDLARLRAPLTPEALEREVDAAVDRRMLNWALDDESFASLDELLRLLREDGVEPVFMGVPLPLRYAPLQRERYPEAVRRWSEEMQRRYGRIETIRFATDGYGPEDFRDSDHLSERGALRFADVLAATLRERRYEESGSTRARRRSLPSRS